MNENAQLKGPAAELAMAGEGVRDAAHAAKLLRLLPLLLVCYLFAHLDRINIGFAKTQMSNDLAFSDSIYGFGAGLFFIAYMLFGVPSNLVLDRVGPRRWIATLMVIWGIMSAGMLAVETPLQFYTLRFLLGVAEAGFFPGILVYLNRWFPATRRAQVTALFALAVPLAGIIGAPVSGLILEHARDWYGLNGWQWMFLIEGVPVVFLGLVVLSYLPDRHESVDWLTPAQKAELTATLAREQVDKPVATFSGVFTNRFTWLLILVYSAVMLAMGVVAFWMPTFIANTGLSHESHVGLLASIPYLLGCISMVLMGRSSDQKKERRWHLFLPLAASAVGLLLAAAAPANLLLVMIGMSLACMGATTALPIFWQLPGAFFSNRSIAGGIAFVSSFGSVASFFSPSFIGWMRDFSATPELALNILAVLIFLGGALVLAVPPHRVNPKQG